MDQVRFGTERTVDCTVWYVLARWTRLLLLYDDDDDDDDNGANTDSAYKG
jgi:hypothetical protein